MIVLDIKAPPVVTATVGPEVLNSDLNSGRTMLPPDEVRWTVELVGGELVELRWRRV